MNPKRISLEELPPSVVRMLARRDREAEREREAKAFDQRWPISVDVRSLVVDMALDLIGLEVRAEGTVVPVKPTEEKPLPRPRERLSAMRILATCDRLALEQTRAELAQNPSAPDDDAPLTPGAVFHTLKGPRELGHRIMDLLIEKTKADLAREQEDSEPAPAPEPGPAPAPTSSETGDPTASAETPSSTPAPGPSFAEPRPEVRKTPRFGQPWREEDWEGNWFVLERPSKSPRDRWPITKPMRLQIIASAVGLCGYSMSAQGRLQPLPATEGVPKPKRRILLGAMRILTRFDRLSLMEQKLKRRHKPTEVPINPAPGITWEFLGTVCDLIEEDERQWIEQCRAA
jgi:hypothetical protein